MQEETFIDTDGLQTTRQYDEQEKVVRFQRDGHLHNENGPAIHYENGSYTAYHVNGKRHRVDGPATLHERFTGWFFQNKLHRVDGPAIVRVDGIFEWYINGVDITDEVNVWIADFNFPAYTEWNDQHKAIFKLAFSKAVTD